jgi:hypothetical protein
MSQVLSATVQDNTAKRLKKFAQRLGKTTNETVAMLVEESLREAEFPYIEFRNSSVGRCAYLKNSNLTMGEFMMIAQNYDLNVDKIVQHFQRPSEWVLNALNYAKTYPEEIQEAIAFYEKINYNNLKQILPEIELIKIPTEIIKNDGE